MAAHGGLDGLKARWLAWSARFAALKQREKLIVAGGLSFAILFGGHTFWIEPAQLQKARLQKSIAQQESEQAQLQAQLQALAKQGGDPDAPNRAVLARLQQELADADREVHGFDGVLVSPARAPALLQTLLTQNRNLTLLRMATLPPEPLVPRPEKKTGEKSPAATDESSVAEDNIYRHGVEIKISGRYHDLLAYVADLESAPQKLLRDEMRLAVREYPVSELTLRVYTLSLESIWLVL